jgi:hypothetical protein
MLGHIQTSSVKASRVTGFSRFIAHGNAFTKSLQSILANRQAPKLLSLPIRGEYERFAKLQRTLLNNQLTITVIPTIAPYANMSVHRGRE